MFFKFNSQNGDLARLSEIKAVCTGKDGQFRPKIEYMTAEGWWDVTYSDAGIRDIDYDRLCKVLTMSGAREPILADPLDDMIREALGCPDDTPLLDRAKSVAKELAKYREAVKGSDSWFKDGASAQEVGKVQVAGPGGGSYLKEDLDRYPELGSVTKVRKLLDCPGTVFLTDWVRDHIKPRLDSNLHETGDKLIAERDSLLKDVDAIRAALGVPDGEATRGGLEGYCTALAQTVAEARTALRCPGNRQLQAWARELVDLKQDLELEQSKLVETLACPEDTNLRDWAKACRKSMDLAEEWEPVMIEALTLLGVGWDAKAGVTSLRYGARSVKDDQEKADSEARTFIRSLNALGFGAPITGPGVVERAKALGREHHRNKCFYEACVQHMNPKPGTQASKAE